MKSIESCLKMSENVGKLVKNVGMMSRGTFDVSNIVNPMYLGKHFDQIQISIAYQNF